MLNKVVIDDFSLDMWEISMERQIDIKSINKRALQLIRELST